MSASQFLEDGAATARRAVQFDSGGQHDAAVYFYKVAAKLLVRASEVMEPAEKAQALIQKSAEYRSRAQELIQMQEDRNSTDFAILDERRQRLRRYKFLLQQALDADTAGVTDTAVELYTNAIEFATQNPEIMEVFELKTLTIQALERAEVLKGIKCGSIDDMSSPIKSARAVPLDEKPATSPISTVSTHPKSNSNSEAYTLLEKQVLFHSSKINNIEYLPFMNIDLSERFQFAIPFTDKEGMLKLSPKQTQSFSKWVRPDEIVHDPCILLSKPDYYSIKQTIVSDCSFIASLAVSAMYERKFSRKLVTAIIYPRNRDKEPIYNPFGKYMVKLHLNGITRKVIIDDYLPVDKFNRLLCSYSSNKAEFWISLLEKAYMKTMGGYDFPGSNSNIDLYALTGWIPERISLSGKSEEFLNTDAIYTKLEFRLANGDVLVTVATGVMSEEEEERTGLVSAHAYAVMDIKTIEGIRLLKLKNPWSHVRWRGNYSELDTQHWTSTLRTALNYDPDSAQQFDNGVFWIDYKSICNFFEVVYMNWNPELFPYSYITHHMWNGKVGPTKDAYTIGSNPQYILDIPGTTTGAVWVLLTRHIMDIQDFQDNKEYIALEVYKGNGKRIYYPDDPFIRGVRINSPHFLCKIILSETSTRRYTLVVSQYEKSATIYYTLKAYSTCPFSLKRIEDPYKVNKEVAGEWQGPTAGGCANHMPSYLQNPKYRIDLTSSTNENFILVELKGPRSFLVGFDVTISSVNDQGVTAPFKSTSSGNYRNGYAVLSLENIPTGSLHIVIATFTPRLEGPYILSVKSSCTFEVVRER